MPEVRYGGENGKVVQLVEDPDLVAVRTRRGRTLREGPVQRPEAALLDEMEPVLSFPEDVLRRCCDRIDLDGGKYDEEGHSSLYGYGRLNAEKAVRPAMLIR